MLNNLRRVLIGGVAVVALGGALPGLAAASVSQHPSHVQAAHVVVSHGHAQRTANTALLDELKIMFPRANFWFGLEGTRSTSTSSWRNPLRQQPVGAVTTPQWVKKRSVSQFDVNLTSNLPQMGGAVALTLNTPSLPSNAYLFLTDCNNGCPRTGEQGLSVWSSGTRVLHMAQGRHTLVLRVIDGNSILSTQSTNVIVRVGSTVSAELSATLPNSSLSGVVHVRDADAVAVSSTIGALGPSVVAVYACLLSDAACNASSQRHQAWSDYAALATYASAGTYSYSLQLPAGAYNLYSLYYNYSNTSNISAWSGATEVVVGSGPNNADLSLATKTHSGHVTLIGAPSDGSVYAGVVVCGASPVSVANCDAEDRLQVNAGGYPLSAEDVSAGNSTYTLSFTGATYAAAGWAEDGHFVIDSSSTTAFTWPHLPDLVAHYHPALLSGTITTNSDVREKYVLVCAKDTWMAGGCQSSSTYSVAREDGTYSVPLSAGSYAVVAAVGTPLDSNNNYLFATSQVKFVDLDADSVEENFYVDAPSGRVSGVISTTGAVDPKLVVVACSGPPVAGVEGPVCPGQTMSEVVRGAYDFVLASGHWTLYFYTVDGEPLMSTQVDVVNGSNLTSDVSVSGTEHAIYGNLSVSKISSGLYGGLARIVACPVGVTWSAGCTGGVRVTAQDNPLESWDGAHHGIGGYVLYVPEGTWRVGAILRETGVSITSAAKTVVVSGGDARADFSLTDTSIGAFGAVYDLTTTSQNGSYSVLACRIADGFAATCASAVSMQGTSGRWQLSLGRGAWLVAASVTSQTGQVTQGSPVRIDVGKTGWKYRDLFVAAHPVGLSGVVRLDTTKAYSSVVVACPVGVALSATCPGGALSASPYTSSGAFVGENLPSTSALEWWNDTGTTGFYVNAAPYTLALPSGIYNVAAGYIGDDGSYVLSSGHVVTISSSPTVLDLSAP